MVDERGQLPGQDVGHEGEPVGGASVPPAGDELGQALRCAGEIEPAGQGG